MVNAATASNRRRAAMEVDSELTGAAEADFSEFSEDEGDTMPMQLHAYSSKLSRPATDSQLRRGFEQLRCQFPAQFLELCKVHLSFLIDVPADFLEGASSCQQQQQQQQQPQQQPRKSSVSRWLGLCEQKPAVSRVTCTAYAIAAVDSNNNAAAAAAAAEDTETNNWLASGHWLLQLLNSLPADSEGLYAEGLFRKCGSAARQRRLREVAAAVAAAGVAHDICLADFSEYSPHDIACVLKKCLCERQLLTPQLLAYFQQMARLQAADPELLEAKRLKGFRLLLQLLPLRHRTLLQQLLQLLARVGAAASTRMTPCTLGTIFGPLLLFPNAGAASGNQLPAATAEYNACAAFFVRHHSLLFELPESVCIDACRNLRRLDGSDTDLSVSVRFAESGSGAASDADAREFTRRHVASLFAAVQSMPDSGRKRALIRKFNRSNGGLSVSQRGFELTPAAGDAKKLSKRHGGIASISSPLIGQIDFAAHSLSPRQQL